MTRIFKEREESFSMPSKRIGLIFAQGVIDKELILYNEGLLMYRS